MWIGATTEKEKGLSPHGKSYPWCFLGWCWSPTVCLAQKHVINCLGRKLQARDQVKLLIARPNMSTVWFRCLSQYPPNNYFFPCPASQALSKKQWLGCVSLQLLVWLKSICWSEINLAENYETNHGQRGACTVAKA